VHGSAAAEPVEHARELLVRAVAARVFPAAVAEVGHSGGVLWREAFGTLTFDADALPADAHTIFDLSSLTKPIATATRAIELVNARELALDGRISGSIPEWNSVDRETVTIQDLLEHSSGLAARLVDQPPETRLEFVHDICEMRLEYEPRTKSIYSDLGFILLGFVLEKRRGSLAEQFAMTWATLKPNTTSSEGDVLGFGVPAELRKRTAPTWPVDDDRRRGRTLVGEVHDSYAAALDGVAGHSGLFGNASGVGRFARAMLRGARGENTVAGPSSSLLAFSAFSAFYPGSVARLTAKSAVPSSSRALGWDTMLPTSSCGTRLSPGAFGHVGFTGTSLWIDPVLDRYFVLLTNRVCHGGTQDEMRLIRRSFHDALATLP
jgi:CubicO group peptidase (beta-lactamase class C family)